MQANRNPNPKASMLLTSGIAIAHSVKISCKERYSTVSKIPSGEKPKPLVLK